MNPLNQTPINPKGFTNTNNIQGVFGTTVPNTFTRDVSNPTGMVNPPMDANLTNPVMPPTGVATPVVPPYDLNNQ